MKKSKFYILAGVLFVLLQIVAIARNLYFDFVYFFWFCDFVPLALAIAFFLRRDDLVKGIINIGLFPQLLYVFCFILRVFFGIPFLKDIEEIMIHNYLVIFLSLLLHLATIIAFGFTYKIKPSRRDLVYSFFALVFVYVVVRIFTAPSDSINYVFLLSNFFGFDFLSIFWIPLTFLVVVLPTYWFQIWVYWWIGKK